MTNETTPVPDALDNARSYAQSKEYEAARTWAAIASAEALQAIASPASFPPNAIHVYVREGESPERIANELVSRLGAESAPRPMVDWGPEWAAVQDAYRTLVAEIKRLNVLRSDGCSITDADFQGYKVASDAFVSASRAFKQPRDS